MPEWVEPMLARPAQPFSDPQYFFELKWDGFRGLAFVQAGKLRLLSRKGNSLLRQFPELQVITQCVQGQEFILDGELVCLDEMGNPQFQRLQPRALAGKAAQVQRLVASSPATYQVFDLLFLDGYDLRGLAWEDRRDLLIRVLRPNPWVRLSDAVEGDGEGLFQLVQQRGLEGVVAKHRRSQYRGGRGCEWLKIKTSQDMECVIGGMTAPEGGRQHFGSLILGLYRGGQLHHVGNVGSGFSEQQLGETESRLIPLLSSCPFETAPPGEGGPSRWVRPELLCKVRYNTRTETGMLRAPVFLGLVEADGADPSACTWDGETVEEPLMSSQDSEGVELVTEGRRLKLTHLKKILFPQDGISKGEVLRYYDEIADYILPHLKDRPLSLKRYPDGIEGEYFFQKRAYFHFPAWLPTYPLENSRGQTVETPLCNDRASLLFLVNLGCIDHNPWLSRLASLDQPDFIMLDLDPLECDFSRLIEAARAVHDLLDEIGLQSFPKTSGSRGLHIYVPIAAGYQFEQTRTLAHIVARILAARRPELFTLSNVGARRVTNRVYIDAPQNRRGATTASPYAVRAVAGATVSTPLEWKEVTTELDFRRFNVRSAPPRFRERGDLLAPVLDLPQRLEDAVLQLERLVLGTPQGEI